MKLLLSTLALVALVCLGTARADDPAHPAQTESEFRQKVAEINAKTGARLISVAALQQKLAVGEKLVILDVREIEEAQVSTLSGARLVPPKEVGRLPLASIPADATVVTYCTVGYRSGKAAIQLEKRLGRPVYNLDGGILEWFNRGGRVVDPAGRPVDRIDAWGAPWTSYVRRR
jgi:rhodanese-related sulfurtransferase